MYVQARRFRTSIYDRSLSIEITVSSSPPDLRIITRPLHTRLSLSSAGMPVDDLTNIEVIRNDWVQNKARQDVQVGEKVTIRFVYTPVFSIRMLV